MSLATIKITDSVISANAALPGIARIRDSLNPLIQFRFSSNRTKGYWFVYYKSWHKVGEWPVSKTRDIRQGFSVLLSKLRDKQKANISHHCFSNVGDLLTWYEERKSSDAYLSDQRKKDIKSAVNCHLMPLLGESNFEDLSHSYIDTTFIWPLQKKLAKASVAKLFRTLKTAMYDASNLHMLEKNPLIGMKITDFGNFVSKPKGTALQPYMVQALLDELTEQKPITKMIVLIMLTLGTRIGETRQAKWKDIHFGKTSVWNIPASDTKTGDQHTIYLPKEIAELLRDWKQRQEATRYKRKYLFPDSKDKESINSTVASALINEFSCGEWLSHDLRKCARIAWAEQGTDFMVGEKMLNHKLNKMAEAYLDTKVQVLRSEALQRHVNWLLSLKKGCFSLV